jgi:hypothetical protein
MLNEHGAVKIGDHRVYEQGLWLRENESPATVPVSVIEQASSGDFMYQMERLNELPWHLVSADLVMAEVTRLLARHVWSAPAKVKLDLDAHVTKVDLLLSHLNDRRVTKQVRSAQRYLQWDKQYHCLTHGDPTFENTMLREDGSLVLIDPVPATPAVPDLRCVDIGKMLQSVTGWEEARYGIPVVRQVSGARLLYLVSRFVGSDLNDYEWRGSLYWCVVHLLRALMYVGEEVKPRVAALAIIAAQRL